uniref:THAP-type domain-containing protein n=1 Tax=Neolamprologus brichardi TaxID=32507 RepID=A0A3Q4N933_NEOBR
MPFWIVWTFSVSSPKQNWPLCICRFPKDPEQRQKWLTVAQRDEGSLRSNSYICSQHFDPSCYTLNEDGQIKTMLDNTSHPLHDVLASHRNTFSERLRLPKRHH